MNLPGKLHKNPMVSSKDATEVYILGGVTVTDGRYTDTNKMFKLVCPDENTGPEKCKFEETPVQMKHTSPNERIAFRISNKDATTLCYS